MPTTTIKDFMHVCKRGLESDHLTVLQRYEYQEFLSLANADKPNMTDLLDRKQRITDRSSGDKATKYLLDRRMDIAKQFLALKLREDYLSEPFVSPKSLEAFGVHPRDAFASTISELMLDPGHCQWRWNLFLQRDGFAGNDIQKLIKRGQWRDLACTSLADQSLIRQVISPDHQRQVLDALLEVRNTYFKRLTSEFDYELTEGLEELHAPFDRNREISPGAEVLDDSIEPEFDDWVASSPNCH